MNSHNTKTSFVYHKTPTTTDADKEKAEVLSATLAVESGLAIADDADFGNDPYNKTGHHVILQAKKNRSE